MVKGSCTLCSDLRLPLKGHSLFHSSRCMQQDKSRVKSKSHIDSAIHKVQSQDKEQVGKGQLGPFHHHDGSQHESVSCKEGLYPSMSCRVTSQRQSCTRQSSKSAISRYGIKRCNHKGRNNKVQRQKSKTSSHQTR